MLEHYASRDNKKIDQMFILTEQRKNVTDETCQCQSVLEGAQELAETMVPTDDGLL